MPAVEKKQAEMSAAAWLAEYTTRFLEGVAPLALIFWGAWWIYPPAAPISIGLMLWLDYMRKR